MDENKKIVRLGLPHKEKVPDFYVNQVNLTTSVYEVLFRFGLKTEPEEDAEETVNVRMSLQHAKVFTLLLQKHLRNFEKDVGEIKLPAEMLKDLGLEEKV